MVDLAEKHISIALVGAGGIGKTSVALTVLNHDRIKQRFGDDRRFLRCDQFPTSRAHFLCRLSDVIGAGIENPGDLTPLRTFLSSREMLIVLDNAESLLDPQGTGAQEMYPLVEQLSRFKNVCICITSRVSTTPSRYKHLDVPTLSVDAALDAFYSIYDGDDRTDLVNSILEQVDFHPLSITLLATAAHQNKWGANQLAKEWEEQQTSALQTEHNKSLAATIELSLASPMFQQLGHNARELLGVVAFFPQGVDEDNLHRLFPTISNRIDVLDKFCLLSLAHRSNGFITMLAPLRDYLYPEDPKSSPLLCATKEHYFTRLSVSTDPNYPHFEETRWIRSEEVNIEHLLNVFTTIDADSDSVWTACTDFMRHLVQHKNRFSALRLEIEGLPDDHRSKPGCLYKVSRLFYLSGNPDECKRLLTHTLELYTERGSGRDIADTLMRLSDANRHMDPYREGILQVGEALEILERLGDTEGQADCLLRLALLLLSDKQLDAAIRAASCMIGLIPEKEGNSPFQGSHWNRIPLQLAP